jgi:hypothetical protein
MCRAPLFIFFLCHALYDVQGSNSLDAKHRNEVSMTAYFLFFGGMTGFVVAGITHSPVLGMISIAFAIIALGCGPRTCAPETLLVVRTHLTTSTERSYTYFARARDMHYRHGLPRRARRLQAARRHSRARS